MKELQNIFDYQGKQIRTVVVDGGLNFVAKDVCDVLEIGDTSKAVSRLSENMKGANSIPTLGGYQEMLTVTEAGVYKLVFTSRKPEAEWFTNWIAEEVIPSIRKNGMYLTQQTSNDLLNDPTTFLAKAVLVAQEQIAKKDAELKAVKENLAIAQPKADTFDIIAEDEGFLLTAGEIAKTVALPGLNESKVRECLRELNILCKEKNEPTAHAIRSGMGRIITDTIDTEYRVIPIKTPKFRGKAIDMVVCHWKQKTGRLW